MPKFYIAKKKSGDESNKVVANCIDFIAAEGQCDKWITKNSSNEVKEK